MTSSLYLELLDQKVERMDEEMFIPVDLTLPRGDGEPSGMVIFNVDRDLVSSLEAMIRRGQAVQVRAMPETLQELRQSFDSTMVQSLPVIESETSADESEISADEAETGDEVESTADESEISTDEAETGDEVESTADESEISTDEAETGDEVESIADESEISADEAETGDEVESTEDEAESGHEGGLSAYESEPVTNMTEEEAAEECCICCEELGDGRLVTKLKCLNHFSRLRHAAALMKMMGRSRVLGGSVGYDKQIIWKGAETPSSLRLSHCLSTCAHISFCTSIPTRVFMGEKCLAMMITVALFTFMFTIWRPVLVHATLKIFLPNMEGSPWFWRWFT